MAIAGCLWHDDPDNSMDRFDLPTRGRSPLGKRRCCNLYQLRISQLIYQIAFSSRIFDKCFSHSQPSSQIVALGFGRLIVLPDVPHLLSCLRKFAF